MHLYSVYQMQRKRKIKFKGFYYYYYLLYSFKYIFINVYYCLFFKHVTWNNNIEVKLNIIRIDIFNKDNN